MNARDPQFASEEFLSREFEKIRPELRAYVTSVLGSPNGVDDVLQEAVLVVLEKRDQASQIRDFKSWCLRITYFKALAYRRDRKRLGEMSLGVEILERVASRAEDRVFKMSDRRAVLRRCVKEMRPSDVELMNLKYIDGANLSEVAKSWGKSANQLHKMISRVRAKLRICVERGYHE